MTRDFNEVLAYYKEKFRGEPDDFIKNLALSAWQNVKADRVNREMGAYQEAMAARGLRHDTFRWILETDRLISRINKKYGFNIVTVPIKCLWGNEKLKVILFVIISKVLNKTWDALTGWNDMMNKTLSDVPEEVRNHKLGKFD